MNLNLNSAWQHIKDHENNTHYIKEIFRQLKYKLICYDSNTFQPNYTSKLEINPYLQGEKLPVVAKKG